MKEFIPTLTISSKTKVFIDHYAYLTQPSGSVQMGG
jgi:hypothetical protein